MLGLSFKMNTDDLRESPNVELAERLIGKGFDVRIYDPIINPERLIGANLRHVEAKLPHLNRLLARTPEEALAEAEVVVVASSDPGVLAALLAATDGDSGPRLVVDLHGKLGGDVEKIAGYEGVGW
jgi:GDP-mannose 6-dehydrogenase